MSTIIMSLLRLLIPGSSSGRMESVFVCGVNFRMCPLFGDCLFPGGGGVAMGRRVCVHTDDRPHVSTMSTVNSAPVESFVSDSSCSSVERKIPLLWAESLCISLQPTWPHNKVLADVGLEL